jgi:hypothetical protein
VYKNVAGRSEVMRELGPGSAFGEASVFTAQTRTASVQALEPITAMVVTRGSLEQELERSSTLAPLVRQLATTFRDVDQQLTAYRSGAVALARATLLWVAMHGTEVAPKVKAVRWIPLRRHLCAAFACGGDEAMACVQAMAEAKLDVENDLLTVRLDHYGG